MLIEASIVRKKEITSQFGKHVPAMYFEVDPDYTGDQTYVAIQVGTTPQWLTPTVLIFDKGAIIELIRIVIRNRPAIAEVIGIEVVRNIVKKVFRNGGVYGGKRGQAAGD